MSGGKEPGLSLFEPDEELPGIWERIKAIFTPAPYYDDYVGYDGLDGMPAGADDYTGAGWAGNEDNGGGGGGDAGNGGINDLEEDLLESGVILGLGFAVMALVWLRNRWAAQEREREDRVRRERDRLEREANGLAPEPPVPAPPAPAAPNLGLNIRDGAGFDGLPVGWEPPLI